MGCTKSNDDNNGNNNGGGNSGGGDNNNYATLIHNSGWDMASPTYENVVIGFTFDRVGEGIIVFKCGDSMYHEVFAKGSYSISGNEMTATYTEVQVDHWTSGTYGPWPYGHTFGFVDGQSKTVTYTIQSCTANKLVMKDSAVGETLTLTKYL